MSLNEDDLGGLDVRDGEKDADANAGHGPQNKGDGDRGNLDEDAPDAFRGDDVLAVFSGDAHGVILRGDHPELFEGFNDVINGVVSDADATAESGRIVQQRGVRWDRTCGIRIGCGIGNL